KGRVSDAELEILEEPRLLQVNAVLDIVAALGGRDIRFDAPIQELPLLALCGRRIVEGIAARIVIHLIFPDVRVDRQKGMGAERVLVSWRYVPGEDALMLVLGQL